MNMTVNEGGSELRQQVTARLDRPTRYAVNMIYPLEGNQNSREVTANGLRSPYASRDNLNASFGITESRMIQKNGTASPADVLYHLLAGGNPRLTRYEQAFRKIGMLALNEEIVPAKNLAELDQYGNIPRSLITKLLAYFGGFTEMGYRANMTDKGRARLAKVTGPSSKGKKKSPYVKINGVVYFYSMGSGRTNHLARGIWAKSGTHGIVLRPIMLFVRRTTYSRKLDIRSIAARVPQRLVRNFQIAYQQAMATAR